VSQYLNYIVIGDLNANINTDCVRKDYALDCLPLYRIIPKSLPFTYTHHSGSITDIDHVVCSSSNYCSIVTVHDDDHDIDHLPLSVIFSLPYVPTDLKFKKKSKLFFKYNWNKADISL